VALMGIDINKECIAYAQSIEAPFIQYMVSDYRTVQFEQLPDILFSSLFSHHFTDEELVTQLRWMNENCQRGFFINDLHRHPLAYYSIKALTQLFSKSYLVKNDAPLSVLRGFKQGEWKRLCTQAGLAGISFQWRWAFRWLIVCKK